MHSEDKANNKAPIKMGDFIFNIGSPELASGTKYMHKIQH
jgi:hypothetical protein